MAFFQEADAFGFLIYGHTDSNASDEYNINRSNRRAQMVAGIAQDAGTRVVDFVDLVSAVHVPTTTHTPAAPKIAASKSIAFAKEKKR